MAFCPGCGKRLEEGANFCFYCGRDVSAYWKKRHGAEMDGPAADPGAAVRPVSGAGTGGRPVPGSAPVRDTPGTAAGAGMPGKMQAGPDTSFRDRTGAAGWNTGYRYYGEEDSVRLEPERKSQPSKAVLEFSGEQILHKSVICTYIKSKLPAFQVNGNLSVSTKKLEFEAKMGLGGNVPLYWHDIASVQEDTYMKLSPALLVTARNGKSYKFAFMAIHKQQMMETLQWIRKAQNS